MSNKKLFYFTGQCLALNAHPEYCEEIRFRVGSGEINTDDFITFCDNHLVIPSVYYNLKKYGLTDLFPSDYINHLAVIYLRNKQRNLEIIRQVQEINLTLQAVNIIPVYLKGTGNLLDNLYPDTGMRMIGDIDVLVLEKDYLKAAEKIMGLGYRYEKGIYYDVTRAKHFPRLFRSDVPNDIEIHRLPVDQKFCKYVSTEEIFEMKVQVSGQANSFVPCDEHKVIINFIHAQLSNLGHWFRRNSMRDMYDMELLLKRTQFSKVLLMSKEKRKLTSWMILNQRVLGGEGAVDWKEFPAAGKFIQKYDWYLEHPALHSRYIFIVKIFEIEGN